MPEIPSAKPPDAKPPNGMVVLLSRLAHSSDKWVQLGTLVLIGLSGLGNWVATWKSANQNREEIEVSRRVNREGQEQVKAVVVRQIQEMHSWIKDSVDEFHKGNEDSAANRKMLSQLLREDLDIFERRQQVMLDNQNQILKKLESARGAPP